MRFVTVGKPAIDLSGTAGVDFPAVGHTWVCYCDQTAFHRGPNNETRMMNRGGQPVLILENKGNWAATPPTEWVSRDLAPDQDARVSTRDLDKTFNGHLGHDGSHGGSYAGANYNYTLDYENLSP